MKTLVIYFSLDGNTKLIAENIKNELNADIIELKVNKNYSKDGFSKFFFGGKDVLFNIKPKLVKFDLNIDKYDCIFIGTPIWAGTYSPPINSFIKEFNLENKKIALFACHSGGGAQKFYTNFKNKLPNNTYIGEIDFIDPIKKHNDQNLIKLKKWITELEK